MVFPSLYRDHGHELFDSISLYPYSVSFVKIITIISSSWQCRLRKQNVLAAKCWMKMKVSAKLLRDKQMWKQHSSFPTQNSLRTPLH